MKCKEIIYFKDVLFLTKLGVASWVSAFKPFKIFFVLWSLVRDFVNEESSCFVKLLLDRFFVTEVG